MSGGDLKDGVKGGCDSLTAVVDVAEGIVEFEEEWFC